MKINPPLFLIALVFLTCGLVQAQCTQVFWTNPSFEDSASAQPHVLPPGWSNCNGTTSDTQPGNWGVNLPPSNGLTYTGLVSVPGWEETASQVFSPCLPAGSTYNFTIDIAKVDETSDGGGDCDGWIELWGGGSSGSACDMGELLWTSPLLVTNGPNQGVWQTYTLAFSPTQTTCQLTFVAKQGTCATGTGDFYVGIDNLSPIGSVTALPTIANAACAGSNNGSISVTVSGGQSPYSYLWSTGDTTTTINNLTAGSYTLTVLDGNNCTSNYIYNIAEPMPVTASLTPVNISCITASGSISTSPSGGNGTYSYVWSPAGSGQNPTGLTAGVYTLSVTDGNGCAGTQTVSIATDTAAPAISTPSSLSIPCNFTFVSLGGSSSTPGVLFQWNGPAGYSSTASNPQVSVVGMYTLTVTNPQNGCSSVDSVLVSSSSSISLSTNAQNVLCNGSATGSATVTATGGSGTINYSWSNGTSGPSASNLASGTYVVTVTDAANCTTSVSVVITQPSVITVTLTPTTINCINTSGSISASVSGGTPAYSYAWSPMGSGQNPTGLSAGTYTLTVTDSNNCVMTQTVAISTNTVAPTVDAGNADTLDCGFTASLNLSGSSSVSGVTYSWVGPGGFTSSLQNPAISATGVYTLTVTDPVTGCSNSSTVSIAQYSVDASFIATPPSGYYPLNVNFTNTSTNAANYLWSFGNSLTSTQVNPSTTYTINGTYQVVLIASNNHNCFDTAVATIYVNDFSNLVVPNVFSPNGDGNNDSFFIITSNIVSLHADIFNRWGLKVYELNSPTDMWYGKTLSGDNAADGTYYYLLNAKGVDGKEYTMEGYLLLTR